MFIASLSSTIRAIAFSSVCIRVDISESRMTSNVSRTATMRRLILYHVIIFVNGIYTLFCWYVYASLYQQEIFHFFIDLHIREYYSNTNQKMVQQRQIFTEVQKRIIACTQSYMCVGEICNSVLLLPRTWELDHIIPLSQEGTNSYDNLQIICPNCHALKTQKELMAAARIKRDANIRIQRRASKGRIEHIRIQRRASKGINARSRRTNKGKMRSPYFNPNHQKLALLRFNQDLTKHGHIMKDTH